MAAARGLTLVRRVLNIVVPVLLAAVLILPAFKESQLSGRTLELRKVVASWMKPMSLSQQWGMYAPDPARSMGFMRLEALRDGVKGQPAQALPLAESEMTKHAWGTKWGWQKTRMDIWRYRLATTKPKRPMRERGWYMRGACVREARRGQMTRYMRMHQESRRFTPPEKVRAGAPEYGPESITPSDRGWCASPLVREMVELDQKNNPQFWSDEALAAWAEFTRPIERKKSKRAAKAKRVEGEATKR